MIVVFDEGRHGVFERPGQVVVLQEDAVLQGLVPALDFSLGLGMPGSASDMVHALIGKPVGQFPGDVAAAIVTEQPRPVGAPCPIAARGDEGVLQRRGHVRGLHRRAKPPGDDIPAVVVEDRREIEPAPTDDLEIR